MKGYVVYYRSVAGTRVARPCVDAKEASEVYDRMRGHRDVEWWVDGALVLFESADSVRRRDAA